MTEFQIISIILAAGQGTRMRSNRPKVMHEIAGLPMLGHVMTTLKGLNANAPAVVVGPDMQSVRDYFTPYPVYLQSEQRGTAHAVLAALPHFAKVVKGCLLIAYGDTPFITQETLAKMVTQIQAGAKAVVLGFDADDPSGYGRLVMKGTRLEKIVEQRDADADQQVISLCNSGIMALDVVQAKQYLPQITAQNQAGEFYLTDLVQIMTAAGHAVSVEVTDASEVVGINSRAQLAAAEKLWQQKKRLAVMAAGVTLQDPDSVYFSYDTRIAPDVEIAPHVVFGPKVEIEARARVRAFSHLEGCILQADSDVGPFARLRPGTVIGRKAKIGNFVEVKNAQFEAGAKAGHLSYIGDATIGAKANIGAGTITCNYDGVGKARTAIGADAFIGSNTALVAPVSVGQGALIGAGSVITVDVPADAIAVTRATLSQKPQAASTYREKKLAAKK